MTSNMVTVQIVNQEWFWYAPSDWTFLLSLALSDTNSMIDGVRLDSCSRAPSIDDGDNRRALGGNEVDGIELGVGADDPVGAGDSVGSGNPVGAGDSVGAGDPVGAGDSAGEPFGLSLDESSVPPALLDGLVDDSPFEFPLGDLVLGAGDAVGFPSVGVAGAEVVGDTGLAFGPAAGAGKAEGFPPVGVAGATLGMALGKAIEGTEVTVLDSLGGA